MTDVKNLTPKGLKQTRRINGEKTISFDVFPTDENKAYFDTVVEEATLTLFDDDFIIKKLKEASIGKTYYKQADAIHDFFVTLINKQQPKIHNGSITFNDFMEFVFEGTGIVFKAIDSFKAQRFENLGDDNRLAILKKGLERFRAELELVNTEVHFKTMIGDDTDFQFRYGHNIKALSKEVDTTDLATVIKGKGDPELEIEASYRSDNADIFGEIDAPSINDKRFKSEEALLEEMKAQIQDVPKFSITVDFVDLRAAGYPYTIPNEGDRVFVIYEPLDDLMLETRILEIVEYFNANLEIVKTEVTLANHKKTFAGTMFDNIKKSLKGITDNDGMIKYSVLDEGVRITTEALKSAQTELEFVNGIIAREKENPNRLVLLNSGGIGISSDGGHTFREAITADGFVLTAGVIGRLEANNIQVDSLSALSANIGKVTAGDILGVNITGSSVVSSNSEGDVVTLENGRIETFDSGNKTFEIDRLGMTTFSSSTKKETATFRTSQASSSDGNKYGASIFGVGDYFRIGRGKDTEKNLATAQFGFNWYEKDTVGVERAFLYGGSGIGDAGKLELRATVEGGTAKNKVPKMLMSNYTNDGTAWSSVLFYVGRDNRKPNTNGDFRSGFEVWQYSGDKKGGSKQLFKIDSDASESYGRFLTDILHTKKIKASTVYLKGISTTGYSTADRDMQFANHTWRNYKGVYIRRGSAGAGFFATNARAAIIDGKNSHLEVGSDSTANPSFVSSIPIYKRTYTSSTQMVRVTNNGRIGRSTSSRRNKLLEKTIPLDYAKKILEVDATSWFDKLSCENLAHTMSTGEETDEESISRLGGVIAEDMHNAGLNMFVSYDDEKKPDGISMNTWVLHNPILKDHENTISKQGKEIVELKDTVNKLEELVKSGRK